MNNSCLLFTLSGLSLALFVLFTLGAQVADLRLRLYLASLTVPGIISWALDAIYSWHEVVHFRVHLLIENEFQTPTVLQQSLRGPNAELSFLRPCRNRNYLVAAAANGDSAWRFVHTHLRGTIEVIEAPYLKVTWNPQDLQALGFDGVLEVLEHLQREVESPIDSKVIDMPRRYFRDMRPLHEMQSHVHSTRLYYWSFVSIAFCSLVVGLSALFLGLKPQLTYWF